MVEEEASDTKDRNIIQCSDRCSVLTVKMNYIEEKDKLNECDRITWWLVIAIKWQGYWQPLHTN